MYLMDDITIRFLEFYNYLISEKKVKNASEFAKKTEVSSSLLTEVIKKRTNIGVKMIQKSVHNFELNPSWLFTGIGPMLTSFNKSNSYNVSGTIDTTVYINKIVELSEEIGSLKAKIRDLQNNPNLQSVYVADSGQLDSNDVGIQYSVVTSTTDKATESHIQNTPHIAPHPHRNN